MTFDVVLLKCLEVGKGRRMWEACLLSVTSKSGFPAAKETCLGNPPHEDRKLAFCCPSSYFTPLYNVVPLMLPQRTRVSEVQPMASE